MNKKTRSIAWLYCYMSGSRCVFVNRYDHIIKIFNTYDDAENYAKNNIHLIDINNNEQIPLFKRTFTT